MTSRFLLGALLCATFLPGHAAQTNVVTAQRPVVDDYYGIKVTDNYRWLEKSEDPEVHAWTAAQNARTRAWLDQSSLRSTLESKLEELYKKSSVSYSGLQTRSNRIFISRLCPPAQQPVFIMLKSLTNLDESTVVLDLNKLDTNGTTAADWHVPSRDGRLMAVCLSKKGSENGTLSFFETDTGRKVADEIPRVQFPTAGGSVAWNAEGTGVFYTRYPDPGERAEADLAFYQQIWFHKLGTPVTSDTYELGREFPRIAEVVLSTSQEGSYILANVANGDGGEHMQWLRGPSGHWHQLTKFEDNIKAVEFGFDESLYLLSTDKAPHGKVLRTPLQKPDLNAARLFIKEGQGVIVSLVPSQHGLYIDTIVGGPSEIRFYNLKGKFQSQAPVPPVSSASELTVQKEDVLQFRAVSYTSPFIYLTYEPATKTVTPTLLKGVAPADFSDVEVLRKMAKSKDGTEVPINIIYRKGLRLDGNNPTLLYGYGGYSINLVPGFDFTRRLWLDAGGVLVIANLRGGGEFGEEWHKAGNLTKKQNVFDDFIGCAEWLISHHYTNPRKLAIEGGSNGGLLMGAVLTQRPELFRAVVTHVGIYDMLRVELEPNGAFNITEFGSVKNRDQFDALYAYSPIHHVKDGVAYPAVLIATGENDGRVNPHNSRKMAARLQAATSSDNPILLRTSSSAGHGMGSSMAERIGLKADVLTFLITELGAGK